MNYYRLLIQSFLFLPNYIEQSVMITVAVFWYCLIKNLNNSLTKVVQNCIEVNCMVENKLCILVADEKAKLVEILT